MNWKLIFQLSIFGLIMAFATVSLIPQNFEPLFWLVIFVFCAYVIAKVCPGNYFLHGFFVSLVNCVWIVAVHVVYYKNYMANHPDMASMNKNMPAALAANPRLAMAIAGPVFGVASGIILGLFSWIASKIVSKR
jgi:hypothetical protein